MKSERKLRLVIGGHPANGPRAGRDEAPDVNEPPAGDEELAAATSLKEAIEQNEDPLVLALRAAHGPASIAEPDLDAIVARALGDESTTTAAERAAAERLRAALEGEVAHTSDDGARSDVALLHALRLAARPSAITAERHEALVATALRAAPGAKRARPALRASTIAITALAGVAALAAGAALMLDRGAVSPPSAATAELAHTRSAEDLFDAATPFPRRGQESARIDRIASARASDLRRNRFSAWGVR